LDLRVGLEILFFFLELFGLLFGFKGFFLFSLGSSSLCLLFGLSGFLLGLFLLSCFLSSLPLSLLLI
jgi:hypothetical protein